MATATTGALRKYNASGTLLAVYNPTFGASGTNAIDLSRDQKTMFYTSLDATIRRFDVSANAQLDDFGTVPGAVLRGLRILPDEGVIVSHETGLTRFDSAGTIVQTYTVTGQGNWGTVALSGNGAEVWGANTAWEAESGFPPMIAKWGVESGDVMLKITENVLDTSGNLCSGGLNIWNEYRDSISGPPPEVEVGDGIIGTEETLPIRRYRRSPTLEMENQRLFIPYIELGAQVGVGNSSGEDEDTDPVFMVRASRNGGFTWGQERHVSLGQIGKYGERVHLHRWGQGRKWVFEIVCSAAVNAVLTDLWFDVEKGEN